MGKNRVGRRKKASQGNGAGKAPKSKKLSRAGQLASQLIQARATLAEQRVELARLKAENLDLQTRIDNLENAALAKEFGFPERFDLRQEGDDWYLDVPGEPALSLKPEPEPDPAPAAAGDDQELEEKE